MTEINDKPTGLPDPNKRPDPSASFCEPEDFPEECPLYEQCLIEEEPVAPDVFVSVSSQNAPCFSSEAGVDLEEVACTPTEQAPQGSEGSILQASAALAVVQQGGQRTVTQTVARTAPRALAYSFETGEIISAGAAVETGAGLGSLEAIGILGYGLIFLIPLIDIQDSPKEEREPVIPITGVDIELDPESDLDEDLDVDSFNDGVLYRDLDDPSKSWDEASQELAQAEQMGMLELEIARRQSEGLNTSYLERELEGLRAAYARAHPSNQTIPSPEASTGGSKGGDPSDKPPYSKEASKRAKSLLASAKRFRFGDVDSEEVEVFYSRLMAKIDLLATNSRAASQHGIGLDVPPSAQVWADLILRSCTGGAIGAVASLRLAGLDGSQIIELLDYGLEKGGVGFLYGLRSLPQFVISLNPEEFPEEDELSPEDVDRVVRLVIDEMTVEFSPDFFMTRGPVNVDPDDLILGRYLDAFQFAMIAWDFFSEREIEGEVRETLVIKTLRTDRKDVAVSGDPPEKLFEDLDAHWEEMGWSEADLKSSLEELLTPDNGIRLGNLRFTVEQMAEKIGYWQSGSGTGLMDRKAFFGIWIEVFRQAISGDQTGRFSKRFEVWGVFGRYSIVSERLPKGSHYQALTGSKDQKDRAYAEALLEAASEFTNGEYFPDDRTQVDQKARFSADEDTDDFYQSAPDPSELWEIKLPSELPEATVFEGVDLDELEDVFLKIVDNVHRLATDSRWIELCDIDLNDPQEAREWIDQQVSLYAGQVLSAAQSLSSAGFDGPQIVELLRVGFDNGGVDFLFGLRSLPPFVGFLAGEGLSQREIDRMVCLVIAEMPNGGEFDTRFLRMKEPGVRSIDIIEARYVDAFRFATAALDYFSGIGIEGDDRETLVIQVLRVDRPQSFANEIPPEKFFNDTDKFWHLVEWSAKQLELSLRELLTRDAGIGLRDIQLSVVYLVGQLSYWEERTGLEKKELFGIWYEVFLQGTNGLQKDNGVNGEKAVRVVREVFSGYSTISERLQKRGIDYQDLPGNADQKNGVYAQYLLEEAGIDFRKDSSDDPPDDK